MASFLLARGPHAFFGHSWKGCSKQCVVFCHTGIWWLIVREPLGHHCSQQARTFSTQAGTRRYFVGGRSKDFGSSPSLASCLLAASTLSGGVSCCLVCGAILPAASEVGTSSSLQSIGKSRRDGPEKSGKWVFVVTAVGEAMFCHGLAHLW